LLQEAGDSGTMIHDTRSLGNGIIRRIRGTYWLPHIVVVLLISGIGVAGWTKDTPLRMRSVLPINKTWKFIKQDVAGAQADGFDDAGWSSVNLPHSVEQPYWRTNLAKAPYVGWYRRHITIDTALIGKKRVFIEFEAVFLVSSVYVNGSLVGMHKGGYTGFSYDITSKVHAGDNVIAVRVDASWNAQVAPRAGEHIFSGGIYRDVYLVFTDPLHVAWYGTVVYTPGVSTSSASITMKTEMKNDAQFSKSCMVKTSVYDSAHTVVATSEMTKTLAPGATDTFVQTDLAVASPHLWSPSTPYLYTVYTEVHDSTAKVDDYVTPLGIRSVRWDKDSGFFMNGRHLWLQGTNVHQDHAGWGDGTTNSGSYRDVKMIKKCGMNFIRGSHYPHDPAFSAACDSLGIALWSEMCFWGFPNNLGGEPWNASCYPTNQADQAPFEQNVLDQLKEMIRIHRNHPSVIIWSMSNEVEFVDGIVSDKAKALLKKMISVAHAEDITRRAGVGGAWGADWVTIGDVNGYNGGEAWISMPPGFPSMQTEYGSCVEIRPGGYNGCYGTLVLQNDLPVQYPWRSGISIWCGFHHGSNINTGEMGMIDHARLPLRRYYYYRNLYAGLAPPEWPNSGVAAKLHLITDQDTITDDGRSDCQLTVQVQDASGKWLSNSPDITLTDKSGKGVFPTGTSITFNSGAKEKGVIEGMAAIEYRSYAAGTATIEAASTGLTPSSVIITVLHMPDDWTTSALTVEQPHQSDGSSVIVVAGFGKRIVLPQSVAGKRVAISLFDMRGRLIRNIPESRARMIIRSGAAEGIVIAKIKAKKAENE
jgi:beta-galactosidase